MQRALILLAVAVHLVPVWSSGPLPTTDGASHVLNARVFRECERDNTPEHEFYARRRTPVPNWTAHALLLGLTSAFTPDVSEKILASLYVVGLPLALLFYLSSMGLAGEGALFGLLLVFNRCFFLGFSNYLLSLVLYLVLLGAFVRRAEKSRARDVIPLALLLLLIWFTHLFGYLLAGASLLWLAATVPGERKRRLAAVALALVPSALLTAGYLGVSGFFDAAVARQAARGVRGLDPVLPVLLHREIFAVYAEAWPIGLVGLLVAALWAGLAWTSRRDRGASEVAGAWRRPLGWLAVVLFLALVFVPDHLGGQGGFLKARLAPVPFLLGLGLLPEVSRGRARVLAIAPLLLLLGLNLSLVRSYFAAARADIREFGAAVGLVQPGDTLVALKPRLEPPPLVDVRAAERYCLAARAVCLVNYEAATRHFPVQLRPGAKERLKENRPGTFWADVVLAWKVGDDQLPGPEEPYREVYRRGDLRLLRRDSPGPGESP